MICPRLGCSGLQACAHARKALQGTGIGDAEAADKLQALPCRSEDFAQGSEASRQAGRTEQAEE